MITMKTKKMIAGGAIVLLIGLVVAWQITGPKVVAGVKNLLISQMNASINGRLTIESVDFSAFGAAVLRQVVLFDKAGNQIASCEELDVSYKFRDLLDGRFGLDSVKSITLNRLSLKLSIDKNGRWSLQDVVKPQKDQPAAFQGTIAVRTANIGVSTPDWKRDFTEVTGDLDFEKQPNIAVDLKGKTGKSSLSAKGIVNIDAKTELAVKIDSMDLNEAQAMLPAASNRPKVESGILKDVQLNIVKDKSGIQSNGDAVLSNLSIDLNGLNVKDGTAKIKLQGNKITLNDATATVDGQKLAISGGIDFEPASPQLALHIAAASFNIGSVSGSQAALSGTASFEADVNGTTDKPVARGTFKLPSGKLDTQPIANGSGAFRFEGETMTIENGSANAFDGTIGVAGTVVPKTSRYNLKVSGQNVDGAVLTDKGIIGRIDFNANVSGQGSSGMIADGSFAMKTATLADYNLTNVAGGFKKQGNRLDLSNVGLTLSGQKLSVSGTVTLAPAGAQPQINLNIASAGLDATVFNSNSALKGVIAFQANVTGTPDKNQARGTFQIASGALGQLSFSGASGGFRYAEGTLTLEGARANFLSGVITLNGTVVPKTMAYRQQVAGQNVDAALLTDRDVQGRADFNATITGQGDWDKANADGNFKMNSGSVKGIGFNALTGNFTKRGKQTDFTDLKFQMAGGLASGTGATEGEYINLVITPNAVANAALSVLTGKTLPQQNLRIRFRGPNG